MNFQSEVLWCLVIGALICVWIVLGVKNLSKVNIVIVGALFVFCIVLGVTVFRQITFGTALSSESISFGAAVELSVALPLSWLPLISDYTRHVRNKKAGTALSTVGYFIGSCMMYTIGLGSAIYAGTSDISIILVSVGLGSIALFVVVFSTVTTTFLDAYSGGVSIVNLNKKVNEKLAALAVCIAGILLAIFIPMSQYKNFLYFIGSVFAPLFAVLITDYFVLKITHIDEKKLFNVKNLIIWLLGFAAYRILLNYDSPVGTSLPVMAMVSILCILVNGGTKLCLKRFLKMLR